MQAITIQEAQIRLGRGESILVEEQGGEVRAVAHIAFVGRYSETYLGEASVLQEHLGQEIIDSEWVITTSEGAKVYVLTELGWYAFGGAVYSVA